MGRGIGSADKEDAEKTCDVRRRQSPNRRSTAKKMGEGEEGAKESDITLYRFRSRVWERAPGTRVTLTVNAL